MVAQYETQLREAKLWKTNPSFMRRKIDSEREGGGANSKQRDRLRREPHGEGQRHVNNRTTEDRAENPARDN